MNYQPHLKVSAVDRWPTCSLLYRHLFLIVLLVAVPVGCGTLPKPVDKTESTAYLLPAKTPLGRQFREESRHHPGKSGFLLLDKGPDALLYRAALIGAAEQSIDLQYYIWNSDHSGRYLAARLLAAADRGVRVRLLLDDINTSGRDRVMQALDDHANIEVRVFNPFVRREGAGRWLNFLADFQRLNRRMHNKALVVDGAAAIIGGRNIGDEYFDQHPDRGFLDRDVLAAGQVVLEIGRGYDTYWNSEWSYPVAALTDDPPEASKVTGFYEMLRAQERPAIISPHPHPQHGKQALAVIQAAADDLVWAPAELVVDRPPEAGAGHDRPMEVGLRLAELVDQARTEILIESAYLVLGDQGVSVFSDAVQRGVRVRALTNSLASNDLVTNHAAYVRRRRAMLDAGMELYELMPSPEACREWVTGAQICNEGGKLGLHTKSIVFDGTTTFIGSFNVNMRSVFLNTEMGLLIHSPELAGRVTAAALRKLEPQNSWHVTLDDERGLLWRGRISAREYTYRGEPKASFWRGLGASLLSLLPVEKYF